MLQNGAHGVGCRQVRQHPAPASTLGELWFDVRLAWRVELMRFRRGYQDDTFVGASLGTAF
ncbi:hypothetical protein [Archangium lansingense]|uniref:Uncharacterized protein n=1 Tax=Archangium lansingense TaxID=2995310 RepID=A0ABT3ZZQ1_9BACT|nr:hypothetical protein [Archangium lansinium]MCY1074524.1 hypothetical protein [Archangium lansinium]